MVRIVVDPVTRTTSGLRVAVDMKDGSIIDARCSGAMYRGFEPMLTGKKPAEAVYYAQRICGMCSVPHAIAAAGVVENMAGMTQSVPKDALLVRNIMNGLNWLRSHMENLYLSFLPDLADPIYQNVLKFSDTGPVLSREFFDRFNIPGYASTGRTKPGKAYTDAIRCIKLISEAEAVLGGRSPHSPIIVPGGVAVRPSKSDIFRLKSYYASIVSLIESRLTYPVTLGEWLEKTHMTLSSTDYILDRAYALPGKNLTIEDGWNDMQLFSVFGSRMMSNDFLSIPDFIELDTLGGYPLSPQLIGFLNYGAFYRVKDASGTQQDGYDPADAETYDSFAISSGFTAGSLENLYDIADLVDPTQVTEQVNSSLYSYSGGRSSLSPASGETSPVMRATDIDLDGQKYSFIKAPRYGNVPCEVGPLARMITYNEPYIMNIMRMLHDTTINSRFQSGQSYTMTSVYTRVLARMQETLIVAQMLGEWIDDLEAHDSSRKYYVPVEAKTNDKAAYCLIDAPRGALGHWAKTGEDGLIDGYQIVSPTGWNASPRDSEIKYGPMELSMIGAKTMPRGNMPGSESDPISIYHIIRSFDPCVSCAVHTIRGK